MHCLLLTDIYPNAKKCNVFGVYVGGIWNAREDKTCRYWHPITSVTLRHRWKANITACHQKYGCTSPDGLFYYYCNSNHPQSDSNSQIPHMYCNIGITAVHHTYRNGYDNRTKSAFAPPSAASAHRKCGERTLFCCKRAL